MTKNFVRKIGSVCILVSSILVSGCGGSGDDASKVTLPFGRTYNITCNATQIEGGVAMTVQIQQDYNCYMDYRSGNSENKGRGIYICGIYNKDNQTFNNVSFQWPSSNGTSSARALDIENFPIDGTPNGLNDPSLNWTANIEGGSGMFSGTGATIMVVTD